MNQKDNKQIQVTLLQQNLSSIRKIAGWTAEQLGEKIGVTKQTISNLENSKTPMTLTQYIAIRSVLDYEIEKNQDNIVLPQVIDILVDNGGKLDEDNYSEIKETVEVVATSATGGKTGESLAKIFMSLLSTPNGMRALATLGIMIAQSDIVIEIANATATKTSGWLKKILK
ncbi:MAG: helix-turn-helix transcriptional regulator [Syntrophaceticus schinkii]|nr:helix-turn-helix transcriptional regulator [Syntrophaceticus schinkii]